MANIKSAKKRIRVIEKKRLINKMRVSQTRTAIKKFETALENNDLELAKVNLIYAQKKLSQVAAKGSIHKKAAARKISNLTKRYNKAIH